MNTKLKIGMTVLVSWSKGRCVGVVTDFLQMGDEVFLKVKVRFGWIMVLEKQCKVYNEGFRLEELLDL